MTVRTQNRPQATVSRDPSPLPRYLRLRRRAGRIPGRRGRRAPRSSAVPLRAREQLKAFHVGHNLPLTRATLVPESTPAPPHFPIDSLS